MQGSALLKCFSAQQFHFSPVFLIYYRISIPLRVTKYKYENVHGMSIASTWTLKSSHARTPWLQQKDPEKRLSLRSWEHDTNMNYKPTWTGLFCSMWKEGAALRKAPVQKTQLKWSCATGKAKSRLDWSDPWQRDFKAYIFMVFSKNRRRLRAWNHHHFTQEQHYLRTAVLNSTKFSQHLWYFWDGKQHNPSNMRKLKEAKPFWCNYLSYIKFTQIIPDHWCSSSYPTVTQTLKHFLKIWKKWLLNP